MKISYLVGRSDNALPTQQLSSYLRTRFITRSGPLHVRLGGASNPETQLLTHAQLTSTGAV